MSHDVDVQLSECEIHLSFTAPGKLMYMWMFEKDTRPDDSDDDLKKIDMAMLTQDDWRELVRQVNENNRWEDK